MVKHTQTEGEMIIYFSYHFTLIDKFINHIFLLNGNQKMQRPRKKEAVERALG